MRRLRGLSIMLFAWFVPAAMLLVRPAYGEPAAPPLAVTYPRAHDADDKRSEYYVKLIDLALAKSGVKYDLRASSGELPPMLAIDAIKNHAGIDIIWGPTSAEVETLLLPIRIPIDKGILGWRLILIKERDRAKFAGVKTLAQLRTFTAGLAHTWTDNKILRANGLPVVEGGSYDELFGMLAADRFQYFPRGVGEIWNEQQTHAGLGLEVEPHLALHYPRISYFFVANGNRRLAQAIEQGLRAAMQDGSFDKLFWQYNGPAIERAHLRNRIVFDLDNPLPPAVKPLLTDPGF